MIRKLKIENFKSIQSLDLELGRFNILIGENGSGKTNILEAIAFAGASTANKLDTEFLGSRGIRVTEPELMRASFEKRFQNQNVSLEFTFFDKDGNKITLECVLQNKNEPYSKWYGSEKFGPSDKQDIPNLNEAWKYYLGELSKSHLPGFIIYSPENSYLRNFMEERQILPLGIRGEGLFKLLTVFQEIEQQSGGSKRPFSELKELLQVIDWFDDFDMKSSSLGERKISIKDKYLDAGIEFFTQRSANEGFLFLLFYFSLFISEHSPKFFAIDNIENALNPGLCRKLIEMLTELAAKHDKQVICTTHNPAILDGLNLNDEEQRLFIVRRNKLGHAKVKRYIPKPRLDNGDPVKLSTKLMRGYLGAIQNF